MIMSETSGGLVASADLSKVGPDYFTFYKCEVKELLSQNEDFLPFAAEFAGNISEEVRGNIKFDPSSGSLFDNCVGVSLSECKKERLNALLRQTLATLAPEVDEMLDPVVALRRLQSQVRKRKLISGHKDVTSEGEKELENANKRSKKSSSSSTSITRAASPFQCNARETTCKNESEFHLASNTSADKRDGEGEDEDDLQFLLENDSSLVEASIKKYSDQLSAKVDACFQLDHMEKQIEELLDVVVSTCRPMSVAEKKQLQILIQKLPPKNLNRVAEIVQREKPSETQNYDEIFVDLEKKDKETLWRLYYYVEAVEKARKLSSS
ncbi:uncharacterized protein LOC110602118 isoform X3 [Manihot esculenta]|uniref:uncharacterized protein LOC110602118 isoform X3 n=1 Tax=Manihot esculenta TaxID=3983 RepID=UPI001CC37743|nr:uncharacterized protein LOC110602118 isoform X3 [Manihot esculenta]